MKGFIGWISLLKKLVRGAGGDVLQAKGRRLYGGAVVVHLLLNSVARWNGLVP